MVWEEWAAWFVPHKLQPHLTNPVASAVVGVAMPYTPVFLLCLILCQGDGDEGDSDDEELPFEASGKGGEHYHGINAPQLHACLPPTLAPIILAIRSSMRLASQNGAKASFSLAEFDSTDCFAPWNVHAQLNGSSVRCGVGSDCLPYNA